MKKLLIISNNPLSYTNNNGKTLLSFIEGVDDITVKQLYFSAETPTVSGYEYFRITDRDIMKGLLRSSKRGRIIQPETHQLSETQSTIKKTVERNTFTLTVRDLMWFKRWKSKSLLNWLDDFQPDVVFFVAGDTLFSYEVCTEVVNRYGARLSVYITDDYIMPRKNEGFAHSIRRNLIKKCMTRIINLADSFFTISILMRDEYKRIFGKNSHVIMNMPKDLQDTRYHKSETETETVLTYTGSFYYKRSEILGLLAQEIEKYNKQNPQKRAVLKLYSNNIPSRDILEDICVNGASEFCGSLDLNQLKERLNTTDFLVFVESFEEGQIEKVRYSLSTKIPEYLSIGKPIIAIGPEEVGSMDYLRDVAMCVNNPLQIKQALFLLEDEQKKKMFSQSAREKYNKCFDIDNLKRQFVINVFGGENANTENNKMGI